MLLNHLALFTVESLVAAVAGAFGFGGTVFRCLDL